MFKVDVHLGEHPTPEDALAAWPQEVDHLCQIGRKGQADKLQEKLNRLRELTRMAGAEWPIPSYRTVESSIWSWKGTETCVKLMVRSPIE